MWARILSESRRVIQGPTEIRPCGLESTNSDGKMARLQSDKFRPNQLATSQNGTMTRVISHYRWSRIADTSDVSPQTGRANRRSVPVEPRYASIKALEAFPSIATPFFASHSIVSYATPLQRGWNCCNTESTISSDTCGAGFGFNPAAEDRAEVIRISMPRRMRYRNRRVAVADISA